MKLVYACEICGSQFNSPNDATKCEEEHSKIEDMNIKGIQFKSLTGLFGMAKTIAIMYPERIAVKFSETRGDFATYKFEHVGFKGM